MTFSITCQPRKSLLPWPGPRVLRAEPPSQGLTCSLLAPSPGDKGQLSPQEIKSTFFFTFNANWCFLKVLVEKIVQETKE